MTNDERAVATRQQAGAIATDAPGNAWANRGLLKPFAAGAVVERPRADFLATISAGYRDRDGNPVVSRDGTIYVSGDDDQAVELRAALAERENKGLTIALVHDDPDAAFHQRFMLYSKTRLEAHADGETATVIHLDKERRNGRDVNVPRREVVSRGKDPDRYALLVSGMKVTSSLFFGLARWTDEGLPQLYFPDGFLPYRLRFTSLHSAEAVRAQLASISALTGGAVAGVPLDLSIVYREVAAPDGMKRRVPIWRLVLKPPQTIQLVPERIAAILRTGIDQARTLAIAAPRPESIEMADLGDLPDVDLDVIDGEIVQRQPARRSSFGDAPLTNHKRCQAEYFGAVGRTSLRSDEGRHAFISTFTGGRYTSLADFIDHTTVGEWARFMEAVSDRVRIELEGQQAAGEPPKSTAAAEKPSRSYEDLFPPDEEDAPPPPAEKPAKRPSRVTAEVHKAAALTGAPAPPTEPARPEPLGEYSRAEWEAYYRDWCAWLKRLDPKFEPAAAATLVNGDLPKAVWDVIGEVDELEEARSEAVQPPLVDAF